MVLAAIPANLDRPQSYPRFEDGEFVVLRDRPIFCEHTKQLPEEISALANDGEDGLNIDAESISQIIQRNNLRIADRGDYPVIVVKHKGIEEVVGFAGSLKAGTIGRINPKAAILTDLHVYKDKAHVLRDYPRLSVEYYASPKNPGGGYIDAVALLGHTAPELDLGLHFAKTEGDLRRVCYERQVNYDGMPAVPCGANTAPAEMLGKKKHEPIHYGKENQSMLSSEDLNQIIEALIPVVQSAVAESVVPGQSGPEGEIPSQTSGSPDADVHAPFDKDAQQEQPLPETDQGGIDAEPPGVDEPTSTAADADFPEKKDAKASTDKGAAVADKKTAAVDDDDKGKPDKELVAKYQKERDDMRVDYQAMVRENKELKAAYGKLKVDYAAMERKVAVAGKAERLAVRYQKLIELEQAGFALDPKTERDETANLSDAEFERYCGKIKACYSRIPMGSLSVEPPELITPAQEAAQTLAQRKAISNAARQRVEYARSQKDYRLSFEQALAEEQAKAAATV